MLHSPPSHILSHMPPSPPNLSICIPQNFPTHITEQNRSQTFHPDIRIYSPSSPSSLHHRLPGVSVNPVHPPPGVPPFRARVRHPWRLARRSPFRATLHRGLPVRIRRSERFPHRSSFSARGYQKRVPEMGRWNWGPDCHGGATRAGPGGCGGCSRSVKKMNEELERR